MSWFNYNNDPWRKAPLWAIELKKKLELIIISQQRLEKKMSDVDDKVNEIFAKFDDLAVEIAREIQQVLDAIANGTVTQATRDKLAALSTRTTEFIAQLRADNPPSTPA